MKYNDSELTQRLFTLWYSGQNESLRSINLSWNGFSDKGLKAVSAALCKNSTLMEIDLSSNRITKEGIVYLTKAFSRNNTLEILKVAVCSSYFISTNLSTVQQLFLFHFQLNKNQLCSVGANILLESLTLADNCSLKKLEILVCNPHHRHFT